MDIDELLRKIVESRKTARWIGGIMVLMPVLYILAGGLRDTENWFAQVFVVVLGLMGALGIIFLLAGFTTRKK